VWNSKASLPAAAGLEPGLLGCVLALSLLSAAADTASAQGGYTWTTIDPPGSTMTVAFGITPNGYISGRYDGSDGKRHGFILIDGEYRTIDVPGSIFTHSNGINPRGHISGLYFDAAGERHGFLLRDDEFTRIDVPGAISTGGGKLNPHDDMVGGYLDGTGRQRGYLWSDGQFTLIDPRTPWR
jgi:hypothetical protein